MATREFGASLANYSREFSDASHIFLKNGLWRVSASLASPRKMARQMSRVWRVRATRLGECWQVWRVRATRLGECWQVWRILAANVGASTNNIFYMYKTF
jgi:hypothetical protein